MESSIRIENIIPDLIKVLRNKSSQAQLSQRMGYKGNQLHRWETGSRQVKWTEFIRLCRLQKFPISEALSKIFHFDSSLDEPALFVTHLIGQSTLKEFSAVVRYSPSLVAKWKTGLAEPSLLQVLNIVERLHGLALDFIDCLLHPIALDSLREAREPRSRVKRVLITYPEASAFIMSLNLSNAESISEELWKTLATNLGTSPERLSSMIRELIECGWIEKSSVGLKLRTIRLDTRGNMELWASLRRYWLQKSLQFLETAVDDLHPHHYGVLVLALSDEADAKVADAYYKYFTLLKEIATNDKKPRTRLRCVSLQGLWVNPPPGDLPRTSSDI